MPDHKSSDWVIDRLGKEYNQPFFLAVGFLRPHVPLYVPQPWFDLHPLEELEMPPYRADDLDDIPPVGLQINDLPMMPSTDWAMASGEWPKIVQAYLACVSFVDHQIGRVLNALEESKYADNTIIVLWSDHGYRLGEKGTFAKHALWEPATRAPLIFAGPGVPEGKVVESPTEMLGIYPTLLQLSGLPAYDRNEGTSLVPRMQEPQSAGRYFAVTTYGMYNHAIRSDDFRFILYEDGLGELYDHRTDPEEWVNLFSHPDYDEVIAAHKKLLPEVNAKWNIHSQYNFQPYFIEQKKRTSK
jgi:arylsulfatase A-like enzyme